MINTILIGILGGLGGPELLLILVIVFFLFGGKKIPELARGLGKGIKEFKDASSGVGENDDTKKTEEKK
jgi:sec-independent protein translocase protein TatA